jgi:cell division protein FtsI (penicillin-binding protein 3)
VESKKKILWRIALIYISFVVLMLGVLAKTLAIQMDGRDSIFLNKSGRIKTIQIPIPAKRGQILDCDGNPLATSVSFFEIRMDATVPSQTLFDAGIDSLCIGLANLFPKKTARQYEVYIRGARSNGNRYLLIHHKVSNELRKQIEKLPIFREGKFEGGLIDDIETIHRAHPHGILLHRTLGYAREDIAVGLEGSFDKILSGEEGVELKEKMATGLKPTGVKLKESVDGSDIVTSIDIGIQEVAENELMKQLIEQDARHGCAIVMEVKTGRIKAIANLQMVGEDQYFETYNFALGTKTYPGSTMKLASLLAALEDGKISIHDSVNAYGKYTFYNTTLHDSHEEGYGRITIQRAFEVSSNVISKVINTAYKNSPQQFIDRLKSFGLADKTGVEIDGEPTPTLYEPGSKKWSGLSLPWMSIGYEVQQTPLQTLTFYNGIANNGVVMKPQFLTQIRRNGIIEKEIEPEVLRRNFCSQKNIEIMKACMEGVVENGTGSKLKSAFFKIAGKTGTSQIDKSRNLGEGMKYQASFVGYFPADAPIYSCIVVIAAPNKSIYGSKVAGTVFSAIANKVYSAHLEYHQSIATSKQIQKGLPMVQNGSRVDLETLFPFFHLKWSRSTELDWVKAGIADEKINLSKSVTDKNLVPDLNGMGLKDALYILGNMGLYVEVSGNGKVIEQSIPAGREISNGSRIKIFLQ